MHKIPPPDPRDVAALGDAVNDVFRALAAKNGVSWMHQPPRAEATTGREHVIEEILGQIIDGVLAETIDDTGLNVVISVREAGELLVAAMIHAAEHGRTMCKYDEFTRCHYARRIVYYACRVFTQIVEEANR